MQVSFIQYKKVWGNQYLLGLEWGNSQLRIGLIWIHIVFIF